MKLFIRPLQDGYADTAPEAYGFSPPHANIYKRSTLAPYLKAASPLPPRLQHTMARLAFDTDLYFAHAAYDRRARVTSARSSSCVAHGLMVDYPQEAWPVCVYGALVGWGL